jgi:hypothetical protein
MKEWGKNGQNCPFVNSVASFAAECDLRCQRQFLESYLGCENSVSAIPIIYIMSAERILAIQKLRQWWMEIYHCDDGRFIAESIVWDLLLGELVSRRFVAYKKTIDELSRTKGEKFGDQWFEDVMQRIDDVWLEFARICNLSTDEFNAYLAEKDIVK